MQSRSEDRGSQTRERRLSASAYAAVIALALVIGALSLGIWPHGIHVPVAYAGDGLFTSATFKGISDNGQWYTYPDLGAPGTGQLYDYPGADGVHLLEVLVMSLLVSDYAVLLNMFLWLSYPLIALAAMWAMRRFGLSRSASIVFALLYTAIPFHQSRVNGHIFLSSYWVVPLAVALVVLVAFRDDDVAGRRVGLGPFRMPVWAWLVCIALGGAGIYYAYFAIVLSLLAGAIATVSARNARRIAPALAMTAVIGAVVLLQLAPSYAFWSHDGRNNTADVRSPAEADLYALRMTQLVFPATGHRIARLAAAKENLRSQLGMISSSYLYIAYDSSLGVLGVVGFVLLLFWALSASFRAPPADRLDESRDRLAVLGLASFLLATVGGVGGIIAFAGFPQIRAYDRITPYIAFLSLCATAWLADRVARRIRHARAGEGSRFRDAVVAACFVGVLALGLFDQTNPTTVPQYEVIESSYRSDQAFVRAVERELPDGAEVFQLPYVGFPEGLSVEGTSSYDPLRMYLHSTSIHWSGGAFTGRESATWQESVSSQPVEEMLASIRQEGFSGVVIDRNGYADHASAMEAAFAEATPSAASFVSDDGRFVFFALE